MKNLKDLKWVSLKSLRKANDPVTICSPDSIPRLARDVSYVQDVLNAWNKDYEDDDHEQGAGDDDEDAGRNKTATSTTNKNPTSSTTSAKTGTTSSNPPSSPPRPCNDEQDHATPPYPPHPPAAISRRSRQDSYGCAFPYTGSEGEEYGGYLIVPQHLHQSNFEVTHKVPVVIMFHTGAGPQDIFNRYQADKLAREESLWGEKGCIIFIADILQDTVGWTWGDRQRYWTKRTEFLSVEEKDGVKKRYKLQAILSFIMDAVRSIDIADVNRVAGIGFCLGGQPILELARMQYDEIIGLVTFHGVFDGITTSKVDIRSSKDETESISWKKKPREVLICNGRFDPYVPTSDLECAQEQFKESGFNVKVINFEHGLHNFSNPRTQYDDPDSPFGYDKYADMVSWNETIKLFGRIFSPGEQEEQSKKDAES